MRKESYMVQNLTTLVDCSSFSLVNSKLLPNGIVVCNNKKKKWKKNSFGLKDNTENFSFCKVDRQYLQTKGTQAQGNVIALFCFYTMAFRLTL